MIPSHGRLSVFCGPMFAGKSTALLRAVREAETLDGEAACLLLKPAMDGRHGNDRVGTHDGELRAAMPVTQMPDLASGVRHVFLDEVQFMEPPWFAEGLGEAVEDLLRRGVNVTAAGLDMDAWGAPFQAVATLLAMADSVVKLTARCEVCGAPANMSRLHRDDAGGRVLLGGKDSYSPVCRDHHAR